MSKYNFDPSNNIKMINFIQELNDPNIILENSTPIYYNPINEGKYKLTRTLLYSDITLEQLNHQLIRLDNMIEVTLENSIPLEESTQQFMVDTINLIKHRITMESSIMDAYSSICNNLFDYNTKKDVVCIGNINQCEIDDIFINGNINKLSDLITIVENESEKCISTESMKLLIMSGVEGLLDLDIITRTICTKLSKACEYQSTNHIDLWETINNTELVLNKFETLYGCDSTRLNCFMGIKKEMVNILDDIKCNIKKSCTDELCITTPNLEAKLLENLALISTSTDDKVLIENLNNFSRYQSLLEVFEDDILLETKRHGGNVRKMTSTVARRTNKLVNKTAKGAQKAGSTVKTAKKKAYDPMEKFIETTFEKIKKADGNTRKEIIIKGGVVPKVLRFLRRSIAIGAVGVVSPAIAGISLLTYIALDKSLDAKARRKVLNELEDELEIVKEKIEDSKGDDNKQSKYELMRIKHKLEKDIVRIRHGLD